MTDEELGKAFFLYTNRNWPEPKMKWEVLNKQIQLIWIQRAKKAAEKDKVLS